MSLDEPQDRIAAAGEYVLGTLSPADRELFERALRGDPALQAEVYRWQDRLLPLTGRVAPAEPSPQLWPKIEAGLAAASSGASPGVSAVARPGTQAANEPLLQRLRFWRALGSLAIAASVLLASLLVLRPPEPVAVRYLAVLQSPDKTTGWVVEVTAGDKLRLVPIGPAGEVPAGKALEFWTKAEGATGPTSLGVIRPGQTTVLPAARLPALGERTLFELSLEPATGSPTGRPTGPVQFIGSAVRL